MTPAAKQVRLKLLLDHLRKGRWRKLPKQVGLKTALIAEELGLIEARGEDLRARSYRLTMNGIASGGILSGGIGDLLKSSQQHGHGQKAKSRVRQGSNQHIDGDQLAEAIGPDVLDELVAKTGLSRDDLLSRLSKDLPRAVDELTPDGKVPDDDEPVTGTSGPGRL